MHTEYLSAGVRAAAGARSSGGGSMSGGMSGGGGDSVNNTISESSKSSGFDWWILLWVFVAIIGIVISVLFYNYGLPWMINKYRQFTNKTD
jgi:hypothetical protein